MSCNCNDNKKQIERRGFLNKLVIGIGIFMGSILSLPFIVSMLDPVTRKRKLVWRSVGNLNDFTIGDTKLVTFKNASPYKWGDNISQTAAYVRREDNFNLVAFSINCSHLGCPVRFVKKSEIFLCPCHGGVYYKDGSRASGPPPRGLYKYPIRVKDNKVEIKTEGIPITSITA